MKRRTAIGLYLAGLVLFLLAVELPDWHRPVASVQVGTDGSAMVQFDETSPWRVASPRRDALPPADPRAPDVPASFQNVTVLTDLAPSEFMRLHTAMNGWINPKGGCGFCHAGDDFASDANPMKGVARDHLRLTRYLNTAWQSHVGASGVTCFTCHRGEPVPPETWFPSAAGAGSRFIGRKENWDETGDTVRKFFPDNGWSIYLLNEEPIRAESRTALKGDTVASQVEVKRLYEMMMQMADGIGVNCGFCHNSRSFSDWSQSPPHRWVGHEAIRMTRDLNRSFLAPLAQSLPQTRELVQQNSLSTPPEAGGPRNGGGLAVCATCHYGRLKPDAGAADLAHYGALASSVNAAPLPPAGGR